MVWINDISELEFYNPPQVPGSSCYGDMLFTVQDLMLQGQLPQVSGNVYSMQVNALSTDGLTDYGNITSDFNYFFGLNTDLNYYFNLQLKLWASVMCENGCFILKVVVKDGSGKIIFEQYTQKYTIANCDTIAGGVTITNLGIDISYNCASSAPMSDACGNSYKQLYTTFNCIDAFSGDYYGLPVTYFNGTVPAFKFYKSSWILADVYYNPLTIKRTISINCIPQKVERQRQWTLIGGNITFPLWKVIDIENQLSSENIFFNGIEYVYNGDTPFQRLIKQECLIPNAFKLRCNLQECYEYQLLGCSTACS